MAKNGKRRTEPVSNYYILKDVIGSGAFSEVFLAEDKHDRNRKVAVKCIDRKSLKGKEEQLENEIQVMQRLQHPNIIKLHEVFEDKEKVNLVLELVTGGELFDRIVKRGFYTEKDASNLIRQIAEAVDYMHTKNVIHRDLKPENLLYYGPEEDSRIMITDFGLSQVVENAAGTPLVTACGTPGYVAPEVLMHQPYGREVDIWSLGVISYILLCGYPPFYDEDDNILFKLIMKAEFQFDSPYWDEISDSAKDFVSNLMCKDRQRRYSCKQALDHAWISGGAAKDTDIHSTVAEQMKNSIARALWKKAFNATVVVRRFQKMHLFTGHSSGSSGSVGGESKDDEEVNAGTQVLIEEEEVDVEDDSPTPPAPKATVVKAMSPVPPPPSARSSRQASGGNGGNHQQQHKTTPTTPRKKTSPQNSSTKSTKPEPCHHIIANLVSWSLFPTTTTTPPPPPPTSDEN